MSPQTVQDMTLRQAAVERDFGLRPSRGNLFRTQLPVEKPEAVEPTPIETSTSSQEADSPQNSPTLPAQGIQGDDRSSTISPAEVHKDLPPRLNKPTKRRRSDESRSSDEIPTLPPNFPPCPIARPDSRAVAFWRDACNAAKDADGNVNGFDAVRYLLMRPGGLGNPTPYLPDDSEAVKNMRKGTIDVDKIRRQQQEEDEIARAKEERRQANKRRYRPRGQVDTERAERKAARAAQKAQELYEKEEVTNAIANDVEAASTITNNNEAVTATAASNEETITANTTNSEEFTTTTTTDEETSAIIAKDLGDLCQFCGEP
ncbi:hypothetical protein DER45DRAFT_592991 [Fusarium avenaceum]|nr:hypothetical protein DER45DRAFT_592991 [Fusarium avenaceum]